MFPSDSGAQSDGRSHGWGSDLDWSYSRSSGGLGPLGGGPPFPGMGLVKQENSSQSYYPHSLPGGGSYVQHSEQVPVPPPFTGTSVSLWSVLVSAGVKQQVSRPSTQHTSHYPLRPPTAYGPPHPSLAPSPHYSTPSNSAWVSLPFPLAPRSHHDVDFSINRTSPATMGR